MDKLFLNSTAP